MNCGCYCIGEECKILFVRLFVCTLCVECDCLKGDDWLWDEV